MVLDWIAQQWHWLSRFIPGNDEIIKDIIKGVIVAIILPTIFFISRAFLRKMRRFLIDHMDCIDKSRRLNRARNAVDSDKGIWLTEPVTRPTDYQQRLRASIPVIVTGNLKGGVGKTTISANLAGMLALKGFRVLLIDLDFQGSLSSMMLAGEAAARRPGPNKLSLSSKALLGELNGTSLLAQAHPSPLDSNIYPVSAFYDLARTENRLLVKWLIGDYPPSMPYNLHNLLSTPEIQERFQYVVIDAPPRMSAGMIQALAAGTHLLIPTILDELSAEAVTTFLNEVETLKQGGVCPHIKHMGVLGSMAPGGSATHHQPTVLKLQDELSESNGGATLLPETTWIKELPALSRAAGNTIGAIDRSLQSADRTPIQNMFAPLTEHAIKVAPPRL